MPPAFPPEMMPFINSMLNPTFVPITTADGITIQIDAHRQELGSRSAINEFTVVARHPSRQEPIGNMEGAKISRHLLRGSFLGEMDGHSDELATLAVKLFDKNGLIKPELVNNDFQKGSGCWGRELNRGQILYIGFIEIEPDYRRQGLGSQMIQHLLNSRLLDSPDSADFVVAWPSALDPSLNGNAFEQAKNESIAFFRHNGFRRIGRSDFFGISSNPNHPARDLPAHQDVDGVQPFVGDNAVSSAERAEQYPIHKAIALRSLDPRHRPPAPPPLPIEAILLRAYQKDPNLLRKRDETGATPLQVAAAFHDLLAIETLFNPAYGLTQEDVTRRDNARGESAVDMCNNSLRSKKEFEESMLGIWTGHKDEGLKCAYLLRKAAGEVVGDDMLTWIQQRKLGCTCGMCVQGWFSPRMRYQLIYHSTVWSDIMNDGALDFDGADICTQPTILPGASYLPPELRSNISRKMFDGYRRTVLSIGEVISSNILPTPAAVDIAARKIPATHPYFDEDGEADYALHCVLDVAKDQSAVGDDMFESMMEDNPNDATSQAWFALPACANDVEFDMVKMKLGLPLQGMYAGESDDEDDMDEDDDDFGFF